MRRLFAAALMLAPFAAFAATSCKYEAPRNLRLDLAGVRAVQIGVHNQSLHLTGSESAGGLTLTGRACASDQALLDGLQITQRREGDQLLVDRQAFGFLTLDRFPDGRDLWLLATGTGLAPFLSILQDFEVWERFETIKLVYSAREEKELAYRELIAGLAERDYLAEHAHKLQFIPVVTREQVPGCLGARITTLIENGELERAAGLELTPEHSRVMLCGNPQMIEDTRAVLKTRGMNLALTRKPGQIAVENYW